MMNLKTKVRFTMFASAALVVAGCAGSGDQMAAPVTTATPASAQAEAPMADDTMTTEVRTATLNTKSWSHGRPIDVVLVGDQITIKRGDLITRDTTTTVDGSGNFSSPTKMRLGHFGIRRGTIEGHVDADGRITMRAVGRDGCTSNCDGRFEGMLSTS